MPTAVFRLIGQYSGGPSGVRAQSIARIRAPISPPPARNSAALALDVSSEFMRDLTFDVMAISNPEGLEVACVLLALAHAFSTYLLLPHSIPKTNSRG